MSVSQSTRKPPTQDGSLPLGGEVVDAVETWLAHLSHDRALSPLTCEAYARDIGTFLAWLTRHLGHAPCAGDLEHLKRCVRFSPHAASKVSKAEA
jgi:site-specific recombinase XerC